MIDFPTAMHCPSHDFDCPCENVIIEDIRSTFANEYRLVITYNIELEKHNVYYLPAFDPYFMEKSADVIVNNRKPLSLEMAQSVFPLYKFNEKNYLY